PRPRPAAAWNGRAAGSPCCGGRGCSSPNEVVAVKTHAIAAAIKRHAAPSQRTQAQQLEREFGRVGVSRGTFAFVVPDRHGRRALNYLRRTPFAGQALRIKK